MAIARVRAVSTGWTGAPALNTFYCAGAGATPTAAECLELANRVRAVFQSARTMMCSLWSLTVNPQVDIIDDLHGTLVGRQSVTPPAVVTGGGVATYNDLPSMLLLRLSTATVISGRAVAGRANIGPTDSAQGTNGAPAAAAITSMNTAGNLLFTLIATPITPVVWHRPSPAAGLGVGVPMTAVSTSSKWAVLRSRRDS